MPSRLLQRRKLKPICWQETIKKYWVSDGGRGEPKQVGRVTPCAPLCAPISRRARSDAPYPPSLRHYIKKNS